jgi:hypothetical protein
MSLVALDAPDFSHHLGLSQAAPEGAWRTVRANLAVVRGGRPGEARHVVFDGIKIKANASKHKTMSYERMEKRAAELEAGSPSGSASTHAGLRDRALIGLMVFSFARPVPRSP